MEIRELICIRCPMGCPMKVEIEDGNVVSVSGNTCKRGEVYARNEVTAPVRTVTSSVIVEGGSLNQASCKTSEDIPKDKIFDVMRALKGFSVKAPVKTGDILIKEVAGTSADIIATKDVDCEEKYKS